MALILCIETSGNNCSTALFEDGKLLALKESRQPNIHASHLHVFIEELFRDSGSKMSELSAVAVSKGPGSYTGLRIGVSSAKGLCFALNTPLISIPTLELMASKMRESNIDAKKPVLYCPVLDARRMEVYSAFYDADLKTVKTVSADILDENSYAEYFEKYHLFFAGDGAAKCQTLFAGKDAGFNTDFSPSASFAAELINNKFREKDFEDLPGFEPFYLKEFMATTPGKLW